jgi:hypothetical protein
MFSDTLIPIHLTKPVSINLVKSYFINERLKEFISSPLIDSIIINKRYYSDKKNIEFYEVNLPIGFPNSLERNFLICVFDKESLYILPLSYLVKLISENDDVKIIGLSEVREYDFLVVYSISKNVVYKEFDSSAENDGYGFYVSYYKDDECIDFLEDRSNIELLNEEVMITNSVQVNCLSKPINLDLNLKLLYDKNSRKWKLFDLIGNAGVIYNKKTQSQSK